MLFLMDLDELFSSHPLCFFALEKKLWNVFSEFELEIFWKMRSEIFIKGQKRRVERVVRENSIWICWGQYFGGATFSSPQILWKYTFKYSFPSFGCLF
jgi:hypothetical protein